MLDHKKLTFRSTLAVICCAFILMAATSLSGCAQNNSASKTASSTSEVTVSMPTTSEPEKGFDPIYGWGCGEHMHEPLIQSTLVKTNKDLEIENDLATDYSISDDGLSVTFNIRQDAKFSDGSALTAKDVAFTINKEVEAVDNPADFSTIKNAEAADDYTCVLYMNKPNNSILYLLAVVGIVPENTYNEDTYGSNPIGSGRYVLQSWEKGQKAVFLANESYYGDAPNIKKVTVLFLNEETSFAYAKAGKTDVSYVPAQMATNAVEGYELKSYETVDSRGISLPTKSADTADLTTEGGLAYEVGNAVTSDKAVRQALNLAVDREKLIASCLYGFGSVSYSVCDNLPWSSDSMKVQTDVEKAKQLLEDAGWKVGQDGMREKDGMSCKFNLYYSSSDSVRQALAYAFADQMKEIGVSVNAIGASWDDIYTRQYTDTVLWGWGSNSTDELVQIIKSDGTCNFPLYENSNIDSKIDSALAEKDINDSYTKLKEAQTEISPENEATWVWLCNVQHTYFVKNGLNVAEQKVHPHGHGWSIINNIDEWSWNN